MTNADLALCCLIAALFSGLVSTGFYVYGMGTTPFHFGLRVGMVLGILKLAAIFGWMAFNDYRKQRKVGKS
jgi:hypothetical protein